MLYFFGSPKLATSAESRDGSPPKWRIAIDTATMSPQATTAPQMVFHGPFSPSPLGPAGRRNGCSTHRHDAYERIAAAMSPKAMTEVGGFNPKQYRRNAKTGQCQR